MAVKKARTKPHIMQSSLHLTGLLVAVRMRGRASQAHLWANGPSVARKFLAGRSGGPSLEQALQVLGLGHRSASQGPRGPPSTARWVSSTSSVDQWLEAMLARLSQPALGQRKALLFLSSRRGFCCINQLVGKSPTQSDSNKAHS